jgi:hypothetical protein
LVVVAVELVERLVVVAVAVAVAEDDDCTPPHRLKC